MFNKNRVQKYALRSSWSILIIRDFDSRPNKCGKTGRTVYGSFFYGRMQGKVLRLFRPTRTNMTRKSVYADKLLPPLRTI